MLAGTMAGNRNNAVLYGKSMTEALEFVLREWTKDLYTAMPGVIVEYDGSKRRALVQPALDLLPADGEPVMRPLLADVPVLMPGGGGYTLLLPLRQGDPVMLLFAMRGIAHWKVDHAAGRPVHTSHPSDGDLLDLNDAIAIPAFGPAGDLPGDYPDGVTFANEAGSDSQRRPLYLGRQLADGEDALHLLLDDATPAVKIRAQEGEVILDAGVMGTPATIALASDGATITIGENTAVLNASGLTVTIGAGSLAVTAGDSTASNGSDSVGLLAFKALYDAHIIAYNAHTAAYGGHTHSTPAGPSGGPQ